MIRRLAEITLFGGLLTAIPAFASAQQRAGEEPLVTGVTNVGPAFVILAIAAGLILTLILRPTAIALKRTITEKLGKRRIARILRTKSSDVLHDFIVPGAYGGLTRIDHAILTSGGIICIQTKHYDGVVFGEPNDPQWSNVDGVRCRKFLNPQIQNEGRVSALRKIVPNVPIANLVVFTGNVEFTSFRQENVIHLRELESFVTRFEFGPSKVGDWNTVWLTVKSSALTDEESRKDFDAQLSFG